MIKKLIGALAALSMLLSVLPAYAGEAKEGGLPGRILSFGTTDADDSPFTGEELFRDIKTAMTRLWGTWRRNDVGETEEAVAETEADEAAAAVKNDIGLYRVFVCDRDGNPVEGAVIQFCDDVACSFQPTDADGIAAFEVEEEKVYDVHVLTAPEGFAADESEYRTLDTFSDVSITLEKAQ